MRGKKWKRYFFSKYLKERDPRPNKRRVIKMDLRRDHCRVP